jgi:aspartyl-tRNA(Asn)/glutamyl-tRNA(Gln) amidotransferase subunit C
MAAQITRATIALLKQLSRIDCTEAEEEALLTDLSKILSYFEQLEELNTEGVPPCNNVLEDIANVMRDDEVGAVLPRAVFLANAPAHTGGMIRVPPVLKKTP